MSFTLNIYLHEANFPTRDEWQRALADAGIALELDDISTIEHRGFVPTRLDGIDCGFEYSFDPVDPNVDGDVIPSLGGRSRVVALTIHGGQELDYRAAMLAAAVLARDFDGILFDGRDLVIGSNALTWVDRQEDGDGEQAAIADQLREQILARERTRWARISAKPGAFGRLLQAFFGKNPAEGLFIVEHEAADPDSLQCLGVATQAWRLDEQGLRQIDPGDADPGRTIGGRMWQYQMVHFFIADDNDQVFINEMDGPKQGMLIHMQPRIAKGQLTLKVVRAAPVLGGYAIG